MQPQSPNSQFDFMLKNNQPVKKGFGSPKLPKPIMIAFGVILVIVLLIAASSVLSSHKTAATKPIVDSVARGQEIIRVTAVVQKFGLQDPSINATSNTVLAVLMSDRQQILNYLANNKVKVSSAQINADVDRSADTQMLSAQQSNSLGQAYITYLQQYLPKYQNDLQTAYRTENGPKGRAVLIRAIDSETALLATPPLKS